ncbi:MAG: hypothetical protein COB83_05635 [Gammaproteobacteria bacterium]|nr:MAG: hypothetical protein COB83_05635 [Gammaproteobacteria bacterium]
MPKNHYWLTQFFDDSLSLDVDQKRRLYSYLAFSYFGIVMLLAFSYRNFVQQNYDVLVITFTSAMVVSANTLLYHLKHNLPLCSAIGSCFIIFFCLALVYHGGVENTALYWVFPFPIIIFAQLGYRLGFWFNGLLFLSLAALLALPQYLHAQYTPAESFRFLASLFVVNAISYINEHYRERSHSTMSDLNLSKEQQANTDALTHLPNRRFIDAVFLSASKVSGNDRFPMVIVMADVDHFKEVNDKYGHHVGDVVLEQLAKTMEQCIRNNDIVARVGGEEFLFLFSNSSYKVGLQIAEKIRQKINTLKFEHEQQAFNITMSFGVTIAYKHDEIKSQLKKADVKLYQAKDAGRDRIC